LSPCACDEPAPIREEGPTGQTGYKGATPKFTIGTVTAGEASVTVVVTDEFNRVINWVLPAIPEGVPYTWTEVNTFEQQSIFELGLETTGGTSTFGGTNFAVTPDATFSNDVHVASNSEIEGDVTVTLHLNEDANITVVGDTTLNDVNFQQSLNLIQSTIVVADTAGYPRGILTVGSCLTPEYQPNFGSAEFDKAPGAGLNPVGPVDSQAIANPFVIAVGVSSCVPQINPVVDVTIRVSYEFGGPPGVFNNFSAFLWQGTIGGTQLDFYSQGDAATFNSWYGTFELRARATMAVGNNNFIVEVQNSDAVQTFTPLSVTLWIEA
jgi:hypothetical protein